MFMKALEGRFRKFAQRFERLHEHLCVRDFAGQKMVQGSLCPIVFGTLEELFISLARTTLSGNVGTKVADDVTAFVDIGGGPAITGVVNEMRSSAAQRKERAAVGIGLDLVHTFSVLLDEFADHFQMAELLQGDVLQHVTNADVIAVEGLHPVLQGRGELTGGAAKLLQQELRKGGV